VIENFEALRWGVQVQIDVFGVALNDNTECVIPNPTNIHLYNEILAKDLN
jgi:hypothetical protein